MNNEALRLQRQVDRLATLTKQVENCTVRAPHDGVLYYFKDPNPRQRNPVLIEEGMAVRQRQELFYLPDLTQMEVQIALNESVVDRVRAGMKARVRFEALPDLEIEGQVVTIGQFPASQSRDGEDIRYFLGLVKLDRSAPGLTPGMTTRVDISLAGRRNVLAVPPEAVKSFHGKKFCFVAHDEELQRRTVTVGPETTSFVEITGGLSEGELVVLDSPYTDRNLESLSEFADTDADRPVESATVASANR